MFGDILENLTEQDLRISPAVSSLPATHPLLAASAPSNQQILDATKRFYSQNQDEIDTTTKNTNDVAVNHKSYVSSYNANTSAFQNKQLSTTAQNQSSTGIFGEEGGSGSGGIFGPTLDKTKASNLFTTISVGVSVEAIVIIGGYGGLGCAWDIAKREGPRGYGFVTAELGIKVAVDVNIQAAMFNKLPSNLNQRIFGLNVSAHFGVGVGFQAIWQIESGGLTILGYAISAGMGGGGGAGVFGGHIWNFG